MLLHLIRRELAGQFLDRRFLSVFALCAGMAALSVHIGTHQYEQDLQEYGDATEARRIELAGWIEKGSINSLIGGYHWHRRPVALSPIVYGLSGALGREATVRYRPRSLPIPNLETSPFESNPGIPMFGVLDLAFIVKFVLSLAVLLFTHDAVCGEKQDGSLRLVASFPVPRWKLAVAKLAGSSASVMIPPLFAFLLAATVMAVFSDVGLGPDDWLRLAALVTIFGIFLLVFSAYGIWVSALVQQPVVSFLILMGLWTAWVFVLPELTGTYAGKRAQVPSFHQIRSEANNLRWASLKEIQEELMVNLIAESPEWNTLTKRQKSRAYRRHRWAQDSRDIISKGRQNVWDRVLTMQTDRQSRISERETLAARLALLSPVAAVTAVARDLAGTGLQQRNAIQTALTSYHAYYRRYVEKKMNTEEADDWTMKDFATFKPPPPESVASTIARNTTSILVLILMGAIGFAGAYVAILRYDVR